MIISTFSLKKIDVLNIIYLITSWTSFSVPLKVVAIISSNSFVAAPKVSAMKVPPTAESNKFLDIKFNSHKKYEQSSKQPSHKWDNF